MFYANHAVLFTIMIYHSIQPIKSRSPLCQDTPPVSIPLISLPAGIIGGFAVIVESRKFKLSVGYFFFLFSFLNYAL